MPPLLSAHSNHTSAAPLTLPHPTPCLVQFTVKHTRFLIPLAALFAGCAGHDQPPSTPSPAPALTVQDIELSCPTGPIRGKLARINLADPSVRVVVTAPLHEPAATTVEAKLLPTDTWAADVYAAAASITKPRAMVAVNANFFSNTGGDKNYGTGVDADVLGLSMSDGVIVSPPRQYAGIGDPALLVSRDAAGGLKARIGRFTDMDLAGVREAVAGIGASDTDTATGTPLLTAGFATAESARVASAVRHPRTAVGVADGGKTLVLVTIDGRQKGWSVGITLPELAAIFHNQGCTDAVNLDGGGSTAFLFYDAQGNLITNRPSDGKFRPVANHLGVIWTDKN